MWAAVSRKGLGIAEVHKMSIRSQLKLSAAEAAIHRALESRKDVRILVLCRAVKGPKDLPVLSREQQAAIGPFITRLNRKLVEHKLRVVPGIARHTYRLTKIEG